MSLTQMSLYGAVMIAVIIIIRAIFINRLPKKTFIVLWWVAMLRLLLPFSIPSAFSAYSVIDSSLPLSTAAKTAVATPISAPAQISGGTISYPVRPSISIWHAVWIIGLLICGSYFLVSYARCRREFQTSLPVDNSFIRQWLKEHPSKRPIEIRRSDLVSAPLTYGIFRPVILMPKKTDWDNEGQLKFILLHEYVHIRRFDAAVKIVLTAVLCVHWFNPFVWAMYILFNRDMELACDEQVIKVLGYAAKSGYAITLISMEERKSGITPLYNSFSKTAIEERIGAIMRTKKFSIPVIIAAVLLIAGVTTVFATTSKHKNFSAVPGTSFTSEEYEKLLAHDMAAGKI